MAVPPTPKVSTTAAPAPAAPLQAPPALAQGLGARPSPQLFAGEAERAGLSSEQLQMLLELAGRGPSRLAPSPDREVQGAGVRGSAAVPPPASFLPATGAGLGSRSSAAPAPVPPAASTPSTMDLLLEVVLAQSRALSAPPQPDRLLPPGPTSSLSNPLVTPGPEGCGGGPALTLNSGLLSKLATPIQGLEAVECYRQEMLTNHPVVYAHFRHCLLYTSPSPRDQRGARMPSSA